ncbi:MAG: hypothetical protein JRI68_29685 [Deltaproteobacteria bacterium]|nr:hypothetical protein [Deltaproteobacteria bacterium]
MPDEAILELVRNQLGVLPGAVAAEVVKAPAPTRRKKRVKRAKAKPVARKSVAKAAVTKRAKGRPKRKAVRAKRSTVAREKVLGAVEKAVKGAKGLSSSEIAKKTGLPQTRVAAAVRELKLAKRIYQGGDRRFARYASDARTAQQASLFARKNAAGPARKKARGRK